MSPQEWSIKQACRDDGCIATASQIDGTDGGRKLVFDLIDGSWLAVAESSGTNCLNVQDQRWTVISLQEQPDKTLTGEYREAFPGGMCSSKRTVALTRTGDTQGDVADPAKQAPRVQSPAAALFGTYKYVEAFEHAHEATFTGRTDCLRDGLRCLGFLTNPNGEQHDPPMPASYPMLYANGSWTVTSQLTAHCPSGGGEGVLATDARYNMPPQPTSPIFGLTGTATRRTVSGCSIAPYTFDVRLERFR